MTPQTSCYCSVINGKSYMCPSCVEALHAAISRIRDETDGVETELSQARTALNKINVLAVAIRKRTDVDDKERKNAIHVANLHPRFQDLVREILLRLDVVEAHLKDIEDAASAAVAEAVLDDPNDEVVPFKIVEVLRRELDETREQLRLANIDACEAEAEANDLRAAYAAARDAARDAAWKAQSQRLARMLHKERSR